MKRTAILLLVAMLMMVMIPFASAEENITISYFDANAYGLDEFAEMIEHYEEAHPGITVEVQHAANDNSTLLNSRINSNDIPDIFASQVGSATEPYLEYAYDWSNDTDVLDLFYEDALALCTYDGVIAGLPWNYENLGFLYNKDVFEAAGITELPTTLSELKDVCEQIKAYGVTPFGVGCQSGWVLNHVSTHFMMIKELDAQGTIDALKDGTYTFETLPNFANFFTMLDMFIEYGPEKPMEVDWESSENMLANGEVAIIHMGDWCQSTLDSFNADCNIGFLPVPASENSEDANLLSNISWNLIVNKDSEHLEEAKDLLVYLLTSEEGITYNTQVNGAATAAKNDMAVAGDLANDAAARIAAGETNGWIHTLTPTGWSDNVTPLYQAYMLGEMSAEEVMQSMMDYFVY